ncbi:hypothetical protein KFL_000040360 [Klebsormidium nitens]|uniref:Uncharacterized protein n=1 Tax=Klebsormidium nitens TaxID=105231 RepID=A0A1Y1HMK9_KLENI|nr:hypothetical protein KFL_000040360 [Klebsormidium nitens]|eukprot:GAQ77836.1 hypothetical protein KFL_000040360 [Klebsormidium nitens]
MDAKVPVPEEGTPSLEELLRPPLSTETSSALEEILKRSPLAKGLYDVARQWLTQLPQEKQTAVLLILLGWRPPIRNVSSSAIWIMQKHFGDDFHGLTRSIKQRYYQAAAEPCSGESQKGKDIEGEEKARQGSRPCTPASSCSNPERLIKRTWQDNERGGGAAVDIMQ